MTTTYFERLRSNALGNNSSTRRNYWHTYLRITSVPLLAFWIYASYLGVVIGLNFISKVTITATVTFPPRLLVTITLSQDCKWSLEPPEGSPSLVAKDTAAAFFRQKAAQYDFSQALLITAKVGGWTP